MARARVDAARTLTQPRHVAPQVPAQRGAPLVESIAPVRTSTSSWYELIARRLWISDLFSVVLVTFAVQVFWLGPYWQLPVSGTGSGAPVVSYSLLSTGIAAVWVVCLYGSGSRRRRVLGSGTEEYRQVATGTMTVFGLLAVFALLLKYDVARGYVAITFPLGLAVLLTERWVWRRWLVQRRTRGELVSRVLVVGDSEDTGALIDHLSTHASSGLAIAGVHRAVFGVRSVEPEAVVSDVIRMGANAVALTPSAHLEPSQIRDLRWALEDRDADLIVAPALTGIGGPRVHARPIDGLPLLQVDGARYDGTMRVVKGIVDRVAASVALLLLSPVLAAVAIAVKATSPGPALFRQERVGRDGETFSIWKFRSMTDGADALLMQRLKANGADTVPLFKLAGDDRITPVGRFIRKWSLDELPQLVNVLRGEMSLVGPRPQRPAEVALYNRAALRRLRIKPGLTGLWQVSGRSDLAWEEAVEMDIFYVDNWSFAFDVVSTLR